MPMPSQQYQGLSVARDSEGRITTYLYHGSRSEMDALASSHTVGEIGGAGRLVSLKLRCREGAIWECELAYEISADGTTVDTPDHRWGVKSCRLRGSMLSRPLEAHPDYRTRWNHYLFARNGIAAVPAWYATAASTLIPGADNENYAWSKYPDAAPDGFSLLAAPTKPGLDSFDTAICTITETARFRTASAAGAMVAAKLNKIGMPVETFGNVNGNWKCDDAEVSWRGKYWQARLTWTRSADDDGWDEDIYGAADN